MKLLPAALTGWLLVLPALAVAQDVKVDYDKAFNFAPVKTYSIKVGTTWGNDLSQRRVLTEFDEAIAAEGWKKVADGQADISGDPPRRDPDQAQAPARSTAAWAALRLPWLWRRHGLGLDRGERVSGRHARRGHVSTRSPRTSCSAARPRTRSSDNPEKNAKKLEKASEDVQGLPPSAKK